MRFQEFVKGITDTDRFEINGGSSCWPEHLREWGEYWADPEATVTQEGPSRIVRQTQYRIDTPDGAEHTLLHIQLLDGEPDGRY